MVSPRPGPIASDQLRLNLDLAWRSHAAQEGWTARADTKASIFFAVNGAVLGTVLAARTQPGGFLVGLGGWRAAVLLVALVLCGLAEVVAGAAVVPLLGPGRNTGRRGTIYFGELRRRDPADLRDQLMRLTPEEQFAQIAHQLVAMARVNWFKHRIIQLLMAAAFAGYVLVILVMMT